MLQKSSLEIQQISVIENKIVTKAANKFQVYFAKNIIIMNIKISNRRIHYGT